MADLFDYDFGPRRPTSKQLAEDGMERAAEHADAVEEGWSEEAFAYVRTYAEGHAEFMGEDVRTWAYEQGFARPPKECAWGSIMVRAAREGIVERAGYRNVRIPPQHSKPAVLWRSLVQEARS